MGNRKHLYIVGLLIMLTIILSGCLSNEDLSIHFIDVGQGDSILIVTPQGKSILIDGGEISEGDKVASYLRRNKIKKIDIMVGTHPHSDHIGGLIEVMNRFKVDKLFLPNKIHTTITYEKFLETASTQGLKITTPISGTSLSLEEDITLHFLSPLRDYGDDLNLWSIVLKLDYKNQSFLFTGDVEATGELDIINAYEKDFLTSNVLKVAHHGSNTSSTQEFLDIVKPQVAIISCGKNNAYSHPHQEVIDRLISSNIAIYRTDYQGTVLIKSDGSKVWSNTKPYYH